MRSITSMLNNRILSMYPCYILHMIITTHDMFYYNLTMLTTVEFDPLVPLNI